MSTVGAGSGRSESGADARKLGGAAGVRQEAEVADAAEPFRQDVEQEATDELVGVERHHLGLVVGAIILPAEADATVLAGEEPAVGDRDAMGVAAEIVEHLLRPAEGTLGVDDPFDVAQRLKMAGEGRRLRRGGRDCRRTASFALSNAACRRSRNRRRYSRDRTRTGRKKSAGSRPSVRRARGRRPARRQWACG